MERDVEKEHEKGQSQYGRRISDPKEIQERCAHVYEEGRKKTTLCASWNWTKISMYCSELKQILVNRQVLLKETNKQLPPAPKIPSKNSTVLFWYNTSRLSCLNLGAGV